MPLFAFLFEHKETKVTKVFSFGGTESLFPLPAQLA